MPFTASHMVVALPFARTPLPAGAVAIGAMAPDLPLFFPWAPSYATTHGIPSLLWTALPIAIALYAVWRLALRPAASGLLPPRLGARLPARWDVVEAPASPARAATLTVLAALIGVLTHVVWDEFTHPGRLGSELVPALALEYGGLAGTSWLQHASSAAGLVGIAVWAVIAARRAPTAERRDPTSVAVVRTVGWALAGVALVGWTTLALVERGLPTGYRSLADLAFEAGVRAGATILVITLAASLAVRWARRSSRRAPELS